MWVAGRWLAEKRGRLPARQMRWLSCTRAQKLADACTNPSRCAPLYGRQINGRKEAPLEAQPFRQLQLCIDSFTEQLDLSPMMPARHANRCIHRVCTIMSPDVRWSVSCQAGFAKNAYGPCDCFLRRGIGRRQGIADLEFLPLEAAQLVEW